MKNQTRWSFQFQVSRFNFRSSILSLLLAAGMMAGTARAATVTWNGSTSVAWENSANWTWSEGGPGYPGSSDDVVIDGAGSFRPTLDFNLVAGSPYTINSLSVGATTTETLTFKNGNFTTRKLSVTGNVLVGGFGTLTHTANAADETHRLFLDVVGNLTINNNGKIDVAGMGYGETQGPGKGTGSSSGVGGSGGGHGGEGGAGAVGAGGGVYDSIVAPANLGSGGGRVTGGGVNGPGGSGGGAVWIKATTVTLDGAINANAGTSVGFRSGGGAGGSVRIECVTFNGAGTGAITANGYFGSNGGGYNSAVGAGAGGRISCTYGAKNYTGRMEAYGGTAQTPAAAGTIYEKETGPDPDLTSLRVNNNGFSAVVNTTITNLTLQVGSVTVSGQGRLTLGSGAILDTPEASLSVDATSFIILANGGTLAIPADTYSLHGPGTFWLMDTTPRSVLNTTHLIVTNATLVIDNAYTHTGRITIANSGVLTHTANAVDQTYRLLLTVTNELTIDNGGKIDVSGKGHSAQNGPGAGTGNGSGTRSSGGGHGGEGGAGAVGAGGGVYGSIVTPTHLGSGGGTTTGGGLPAGQSGGSGGGAVKLVTPTLTVNGVITANAGTTIGTRSGGGSGGSIWIDCDTLNGTGGGITANGGNAVDGAAGSGGGGRISCAYGVKNYTGSMTAYGGTGGGKGAAGTVYQKADGAQYGQLLVDNNGQTATTRTLLPSPLYGVAGELLDIEIALTNRGAVKVSGTATNRSLTIATANEPLDLGAAGTVLTMTLMSIQGVPYTKGGTYTTNNWNGFATPSGISGSGAILIIPPPPKGTVLIWE